MLRIIGVIAAGWLLVAPAPEAAADVITSVTGGRALNLAEGLFGESFTTTSLVAETNITFNFFADVPATTPAAFGTGFLLSQEYLGPASGLSPATPGFLAQATASGGTYSFGSLVTLQPSTKYYFYENALVPLNSVSGSAVYTGGSFYYAYGPTSNFLTGFSQGAHANFLVQGTAALQDATAVPEPRGCNLAGLAALIFGLRHVLRNRRRTEAAASPA
jgi:hypothetical protein